MEDLYLKIQFKNISKKIEELTNNVSELNSNIEESISFNKKNPVGIYMKKIETELININDDLRKSINK